VIGVSQTEQPLDRLFRTDTAQVALIFEPAFGRHLAAGDAAQLLVITDATEPNTGSSRQLYVNAVIQQYESDMGKRSGAVRITPQVRRASIRRARARTCSCPGSWQWCSPSSPR
jgi:hypothetical protein